MSIQVWIAAMGLINAVAWALVVVLARVGSRRARRCERTSALLGDEQKRRVAADKARSTYLRILTGEYRLCWSCDHDRQPQYCFGCRFSDYVANNYTPGPHVVSDELDELWDPKADDFEGGPGR